MQVPNDVKHKFRALLEASVESSIVKKRKLNEFGKQEISNEYNSNQRVRGSMDAIVRKGKYGVQKTLNQKYVKEEGEVVCQQIARFFYTIAIPFEAVNNPEFPILLEKVAKFGIGFKRTSYHDMRATFLNKEKANLVWTLCATHCIDLMLEDLEKHLKVHNSTISKARKITTYIYFKTLLLTWMKEFTKGRELIRPTITRCAT